jgi:D-glycero-D-manno-heptose 1,7-bisphosphate phosphatase
MSDGVKTHNEQSSPITHQAIFLDRDGVINKVVFRDGLPVSPRSIEEFVLNEGIREAVSEFRKHGFKIIVITNQPDIARGRVTLEVLDGMTRQMRQELPIDDVFMCLHDDGDECPCRKPKPGLLLQAALKWDLYLPDSFFIGDTWKDVEAGRAVGCKTILLDAPYNQDVVPDLRVKSLSEAVEMTKCFMRP